MRLGYYINSRDQLAILYPYRKAVVWTTLGPDGQEGWFHFEMTNLMEAAVDWDFIGDL